MSAFFVPDKVIVRLNSYLWTYFEPTLSLKCVIVTVSDRGNVSAFFTEDLNHNK